MAGSCSAQSVPLKQRLKLMEEADTKLPLQYYFMTLGMIALVVLVPLVYRYIWLFMWDIVSGVQQDISRPKPPKGCRQMGTQAVRNLTVETDSARDQKLPKHTTFPEPSSEDFKISRTSDESQPRLNGRIEALFLHPIKSTPPIEVTHATITSSGLEFDRIFSFAQLASQLPDSNGHVEHKWKMISQRESAQLALLETEIWIPDPDLPDYDEDDLWAKNGGCLVVRFPFVPDFEMTREGFRNMISQFILKWTGNHRAPGKILEMRLPLVPCPDRIKEQKYQSQNVMVFKDYPGVWDMSCEVEADILQKLGYSLGISNPFTIFRIHQESGRVLYKSAPAREQIGYQPRVVLQDAYPISIQNINSVKAVETSAKDMAAKKGNIYRPDARRFRGNIYVSGPTSFVENNFLRMAIQPRAANPSDGPPIPIVLAMPSRIPRCMLPNNDPLLGVKDRQIHQPLSVLNQRWMIDSGAKTGCLGMAAVPLSDSIDKTLRAGDEIVFYKHGEHLYNVLPAKELHTPKF